MRSEIQTLERNDFAQLKTENVRIATELDKWKQKVREDMNRFQASTRLELNLERGRQYDEDSELIVKLKESEAKVRQEVAQQQAAVSLIRYETMRNLLTTASTLGLVILGYMRLFK